MEIPLQITARDIELTDAIKADITEKAAKLDIFYDRITRCRVIIESPKRHQHDGKLYSVHIYITVPGAELVIKRELDKDIYVALRDAFRDARRKLDEFVRKQRGDIKFHEEMPHGVISSLFPDKGYGFLTASNGLNVYFHEHSVINEDFNRLKVGMKVRFVEEAGEKGTQASTVALL